MPTESTRLKFADADEIIKNVADPSLKARLQRAREEELLEALEAREAAKARKEAQKRASIEMVAQHEAEMATRRASCNHRKENGKSRYARMQLSTGQIVSVCQFCADKRFDPPLEDGQVALDAFHVNSIPPSQIGGQASII